MVDFDNTELKKKAIESWEKSGLLEAYNPKLRENVAMLFEAQAKQLINEEREKNPSEFPSILPICIRLAKQMSYNWMDLYYIEYEVDENRIMF